MIDYEPPTSKQQQTAIAKNKLISDFFISVNFWFVYFFVLWKGEIVAKVLFVRQIHKRQGYSFEINTFLI